MDTTYPQNQYSNVPAGLDPTAFYLTKAIKQAETGGRQNAYNTTGASGEYGAYQFTKPTWQREAKKYLGSSDAEMTEENQNKVAYNYVKSLLDQGYTQSQVASIWNSGKPDKYALGNRGTGTNSLGVRYDVPGYVDKVKNVYISYYQGTNQPQPVSEQPQIEQPLQETKQITGVDFTDTANKKNLPKGLEVAQSITPFGKIAEKIGGLLAKKANKNDIRDAMASLLDAQMKTVGQIQTYEDEGKDTTELKQALKSIQNTISSLSENSDKLIQDDITAKELIGSAISGVGMLAGGSALKGASLLTKVLAGAASGYAIDVGTNLEDKEDLNKKDFIPGFGTGISTALPFAGALLSRIATKVGGITAKTGEEVLELAYQHPDEIGATITKYANSPEKKTELVRLADDAFKTFKKSMVDEFGTQLKTITGKSSKSAAEIAKESFEKSMEGFGVSLKESTKKPGTFIPDLSKSKLTQTQRDEVKWLWNELKNFKGNSLDEMQNLKELMSNTKNKFLRDVASKMVESINRAYPGYSDSLKKYQEGIALINKMKSEISSVGKATDTTKLNRIMKIFKKDPVIRQNLVKLMGKDKAEEFLKEVAGAILSNWFTAGSAGGGLLPTLGGLAGYAAHGIPGGAAGVAGLSAIQKAAQSPRIVGKAARVLGGESSNTGSFLNIAKIMGERKAAEQNESVTGLFSTQANK